jgi:hypothetical protein
MRSTISAIGACVSALMLITGCSGGGGTAPLIPVRLTQGQAHAQGRWLTSELSVPFSIDLSAPGIHIDQKYPDSLTCPQSSMRNIATLNSCGGSQDIPTGYTWVSRTTSSMNPYYSQDQESSDLASATYGTFAGDPGYDAQFNYSDGTSVIIAYVADNQFAILRPDGTAIVMQDTQTTTGDALQSVSTVTTTQASSMRSAYRLSQTVCNAATVVAGFGAGALAEFFFPEAGPWSYRLGYAGGAALMSWAQAQRGSPC